MADGGKKAAPEKGGRYGLPGIPSYFDRVSQETIYAQKIHGEEAYLEKCKGTKVGSHTDSLGVLKGFEIIKYPSFVEVKKVEPADLKKTLQEKGAFHLDPPEEIRYEPNVLGQLVQVKGPKDPETWLEKMRKKQAESLKTSPNYLYKYFSEKKMAMRWKTQSEVGQAVADGSVVLGPGPGTVKNTIASPRTLAAQAAAGGTGAMASSMDRQFQKKLARTEGMEEMQREFPELAEQMQGGKKGGNATKKATLKGAPPKSESSNSTRLRSVKSDPKFMMAAKKGAQAVLK